MAGGALGVFPHFAAPGASSASVECIPDMGTSTLPMRTSIGFPIAFWTEDFDFATHGGIVFEEQS